MVSQPVLCRYCQSSDVVRYGTQSGSARLKCKDCGRIFKTEYVYRACEPDVKDQVVEMATNGSGIRDTARVLGIAKNTVISTLKKSSRMS
jgi:transposase-like protein